MELVEKHICGDFELVNRQSQPDSNQLSRPAALASIGSGIGLRNRRRYRVTFGRYVRYCLICVITVACFSGCVQRRLQIRSQPEGALVSIDRQPVGLTPLSVPFTYNGTRELQLEKEGFKTVRVDQNVRAPWFDKFPISFFSNHFAGREIRDDRIFDFSLEPKEQLDEGLLFDRANQLRNNIQRGTLTAPIN